MEPAKKRLTELHEFLYKRARKEALSYPGFGSLSVRNYAKSYMESLPEKPIKTTEKEVIDSALENKVLLFGDFHTLKKSQDGLIHLTRKIKTTRPNQKITIMMEAFRSIDQSAIDQYLEEKISEEEFIESTDYYKSWGFPWENYKSILSFAKTNKIEVRGINTKNAGKDPLEKRDKFAAQLIETSLDSDPNQLIIVLIGEYHLGDHNILKYFSQYQPIRLFTNIDKYYFMGENFSAKSYLYLKPQCFCLINSPPWIKWQSYCLWEETRNAIPECESHSLEQEDDIYTEEGIDLEYQTHILIQRLVDFIDIDLDTLNLSRFIINYNKNSSSVHHYFDIDSNTIDLSKLNFNYLAYVSGQYIHNINRDKSTKLLSETELFCYNLLNHISGSISNLILNPNMGSKIIQKSLIQINPQDIHHKYLNNLTRQRITQAIQYGSNLACYSERQKITGVLASYLAFEIYKKALNLHNSTTIFKDIFQFSPNANSYEDYCHHLLDLYGKSIA